MSEFQEGEEVTAAQLEKTMGDPLWRIRNLYKITDKKGRIVDFVPNFVQEQLLNDIFVDKCRRLLVLKSRKHGVSTLIEIIIFDLCYFGENLQASIVDLTADNASDKLVKILRFAWESLSDDVREALVVDNKKMIEFGNRSVVNAGKAARGGQNQILHISEWGPIAHKDPERSTEIKTGALPSADEGMQFIESTFMGGKGGDFYELIKRTLETPEDQKTDKDFRFRFFSWFQDPRNTLEGDVAWIPKSVMSYLAGIDKKCGVKLTPGQKVWYYKTAQEQGIFMKREYPSTVEEAFSAPVEGAIYGEVISEIRAAGHIIPFSRDRGSPCFTCWDLDWNDTLSVWIVQMVGLDLRWLWHHSQRHLTVAEMMLEIDRTEIPIAGHYFPHDGSNGNVVSGKVSPIEACRKAGGVNVTQVPKIQNKWTGINLLRDVLGRSWFNEPACTYGISALESYHTKEETINGVTSQFPVHDWSSHPCDAARTFAEAMELGLVKEGLAKRVLSAPRSPGGEILVDLEAIRQRTGALRKTVALSGTRRR